MGYNVCIQSHCQFIDKEKTQNIYKLIFNKATMKKNKKKEKIIYQDSQIYFQTVIIIILIPILVFAFASSFRKTDKPCKSGYSQKSESVELLTNKKIYNPNDEIILALKNNSDNSIYFEPCEYLNNFEKKIDGVWKSAGETLTDKIYDASSFDRKRNITRCEIELPKSGKGVYRSVVQIYYGCKKPDKNMCETSKTFYSNEFEVAGGCGCGK